MRRLLKLGQSMASWYRRMERRKSSVASHDWMTSRGTSPSVSRASYSSTVGTLPRRSSESLRRYWYLSTASPGEHTSAAFAANASKSGRSAALRIGEPPDRTQVSRNASALTSPSVVRSFHAPCHDVRRAGREGAPGLPLHPASSEDHQGESEGALRFAERRAVRAPGSPLGGEDAQRPRRPPGPRRRRQGRDHQTRCGRV